MAATVFYFALPKPPLLDGVASSQAVYDENHNLLRLTLTSDEKYRLFLPLAQISPTLIAAVLLKEDRHFRAHPGFNPLALFKAAWTTYALGGRRTGGSTITMQLARLRYGIRSRTLTGKLTQIYKAIQIERHYTKDEILTAYLNLAPYGRNVEGVGAASLIYFAKNASALTLPEALTLAVIPQSPTARAPDKTDSASQNHVARARTVLFADWLKIHPDDADKKLLFDMPLTASSPDKLPFEAPHFVDWILSEEKNARLVVTTIDLTLQKTLERHVANYVERHESGGIKNASALILDWRSMQVKALVGSADFSDKLIFGQVDGTRAKRSPGSALKPFVYALALDQGLIHPMTLLKDSPASFGGYDPENFDREFLGPVSVKDALIKSRNIPAVAVAAGLSEPSMHGFLKSAGITGLKDEKFYGLTTALGGAEVSPREISALYAMLANGGVLKEPVYTSHPVKSEEKRLLSPEASFLVLDILRQAPAPEPYAHFSKTTSAVPVAWKTGTSFSFRDAWTVGIAGPYVICVWIGNFDGKGDPAFIGRVAAAPLFFDVVNHLKPQLKVVSALPNLPPENLSLKNVEVCSVSGALPNPSCPHRAHTWFIPGKSPIKTCEVHRRIPIDTATGLRACSADQPSASADVYEFWPSDLGALFKLAGIPRREPPPYAPECSLAGKANSGSAPEIVSPQNDVTYFVRSDRIKSEQIAFKAISDADVRHVFWFVDDDFVGKTPFNKAFLWTPTPGHYRVRAVDDNGRTDSRTLTVNYR